MPDLIIRDISEDNYRRLDELAARHGISVEEYVLGLIIEAARNPGRRNAAEALEEIRRVRDHGRRNAGEVLEEIRRRYPDVGLEEGEIKELRSPIKPADFS